MKISLDTTPEHDAALDTLNAKSNGDSPAPADEFAASLLSDYLDSLVAADKQTRLEAARAALTIDDLPALETLASARIGISRL